MVACADVPTAIPYHLRAVMSVSTLQPADCGGRTREPPTRRGGGSHSVQDGRAVRQAREKGRGAS
eukprot:96412-Pleurochrysis_carterae.AAC.3